MSDTSPTTPPIAPVPRALPYAPIPTVAYDAIIEEGWGDSVAQSLNNVNEAEQWLTYPDESGTSIDIDAPTASTFSVWLSPGQLYIPDWAALTIVNTELASITEKTGGPNTLELQLSIGGIVSDKLCRTTAPVGAGQWFSVFWACRIDVSTLTGLQDVQIFARRISGSGTWNFGGVGQHCGLGVFPRFIGAVNWYGE